MTKLVLAATFALAAMGSALAYDGEDLAPKAKVSLDEAQAIALQARPGVLETSELEEEKGGSGLRYSFDIKAADAAYEVGIDAADGTVLENAPEDGAPD